MLYFTQRFSELDKILHCKVIKLDLHILQHVIENEKMHENKPKNRVVHNSCVYHDKV